MTKAEGKNSLFDELDQYHVEQDRLKWQGTFGEYLEIIRQFPFLARSAHQTVYAAITSRPDFFTTGPKALFGAEAATSRLIDILKAGAQGLEVGKRIIIFVGPPGSGKTTLINGTKRGLEEFSKTDAGATYAIADCPMNEDPLHLVPPDLRPVFADRYGISIEGELCPYCRAKYANSTGEALKNVPVKRIFYSEADRVGIGSFKPIDPKSQDMTELLGSVDFSKLPQYGTSSDPRAYRFDGELCIANRGVMEFVEMLKVDPRFLYVLLDLVQDKVIKPPRYPNVFADEIVLAHTNMAEYRIYVADPKNEAIKDRMVVIEVPYTLRVSDEYLIHQKLIAESELIRDAQVHINPHTLEVAAMFAVISRLLPSKKVDKMRKLKIYNGVDVDGNLTKRDLKELQEECPDEGMSGISPRYVIDSLSTALVKTGRSCLTPIDTLRALRDNLDYHPHTRDMKKEDKDALLTDLAAVKAEFEATAIKEVQGAFIYSYEDAARSLCDNYLTHIEAYCNKTKLTDPLTEEEVPPDEKMMRSIEELIGIADNGKREFRSELLMRMASMYRKGEKFDYRSHPRLREAIEKRLFADLKDVVKLSTSAKVPNEEQQKRIRDVENTLIKDKGYCPHCAAELIRYVGTLLNR